MAAVCLQFEYTRENAGKTTLYLGIFGKSERRQPVMFHSRNLGPSGWHGTWTQSRETGGVLTLAIRFHYAGDEHRLRSLYVVQVDRTTFYGHDYVARAVTLKLTGHLEWHEATSQWKLAKF